MRLKSVEHHIAIPLIIIGVEDGIRQIGCIDMDKYQRNQIKDSEILRRAPAFVTFYMSVKSILKVRETKLLAKQSKSKETSQTSIPTTPETQWTHPRDPKYSGSSTQSKDEDYTQEMLSLLLTCILLVLDEPFRKLSWVKSNYEVLLDKTLSHVSIMINN